MSTRFQHLPMVLGLKQFCAESGLSKRAVYALLEAGKLKRIPVGPKKSLLRRADLEALLT
jgi:hypothetical protein